LPRLGDAAPKLFEQKSLFGDDLSQDDTILDWLGDVANAVWNGDRDSDRLDADLLGQLGRYGKSAALGFSDASIQTRRYRRVEVRLNSELAAKATALVTDTPAAQRTRVKGVLNTIAFLDRGVQLNLEGGTRLRVLWSPEDLEPLRHHWGQAVLLEGLLEHKPNGRPLILIADAIRAATVQDEFWRDLPSAAGSSAGASRIRIPHGTENPLARLRGVLDGVVDDATFAEMVEAFS
jgi:hypothetical protein